jgi:hypothetical protein
MTGALKNFGLQIMVFGIDGSLTEEKRYVAIVFGEYVGVRKITHEESGAIQRSL